MAALLNGASALGWAAQPARRAGHRRPPRRASRRASRGPIAGRCSCPTSPASARRTTTRTRAACSSASTPDTGADRRRRRRCWRASPSRLPRRRTALPRPARESPASPAIGGGARSPFWLVIASALGLPVGRMRRRRQGPGLRRRAPRPPGGDRRGRRRRCVLSRADARPSSPNRRCMTPMPNGSRRSADFTARSGRGAGLHSFLEQHLAVLGEVGEQRQPGAADGAGPVADRAFDDGERRQALPVEGPHLLARSRATMRARTDGGKAPSMMTASKSITAIAETTSKARLVGDLLDPFVEPPARIAPVVGRLPDGPRVAAGALRCGARARRSRRCMSCWERGVRPADGCAPASSRARRHCRCGRGRGCR